MHYRTHARQLGFILTQIMQVGFNYIFHVFNNRITLRVEQVDTSRRCLG